MDRSERLTEARLKEIREMVAAYERYGAYGLSPAAADRAALLAEVDALQQQVQLLEAIAVWRDGEITEGSAVFLTGLDRVSLRECYQEVVGLVLTRLKRPAFAPPFPEAPTTDPA